MSLNPIKKPVHKLGMWLVVLNMLITPDNVYAIWPQLHSLLAYESALIKDVPTEIRAYVGNPDDCINKFRDNICEGAFDEDADRDPRLNGQDLSVWIGLLNWGTHFWDPVNGPAGGILYTIGGLPVNLDRQNAYQRAENLYTNAKALYNTDPFTAYYLLGRVEHLLTDMATPAHVHLDAHISDKTVTGDDSFEEYTAAKYVFKGSLHGRIAFETDFLMSGITPVDYKKLPDGDYSGETPLFRLFYSMAAEAKTFDSDDVNGTEDNGLRRGSSVTVSHNNLDTVYISRTGYPDEILHEGFQLSLSRSKFILRHSTLETFQNAVPPYEEVKLDFTDGTEVHKLVDFKMTDIGDIDAAILAGALLQAAVKHVSALYRLFWSETHPGLETGSPDIILNKGAHQLLITRPSPVDISVDVSANVWKDTETEAYIWLDTSLNGTRTRLYYNNGNWSAFDNFSQMRPLMYSFRLTDINNYIWRVADDTLLLPDVSFSINLCLDKNLDARYTPEESICNGVLITLK